jgi:nitrilase
MYVAALQLPSIGMSTTKLYHYVRIAQKRGVKLMLLGEYLLNSFFRELQQMPVRMIKEQSDHHLKVLKELAHNYQMTFVAPIVIVKRGLPYKTIVRVGPHSSSYYYQQLLIPYEHWNEAKFFANETGPLHEPMQFKIDGIRFAVMGGYELHFDPLWACVEKKKIDCVLLPTVSTFESHQRWAEMIRMRAFTHHCYILRANRIGTYQDNKHTWRFYGDTLLSSPEGDVITTLGQTEELMIASIDHQEVIAARRSWGFHDALRHRL